MMKTNVVPQRHWQEVYTQKDPTQVSWFQSAPTPSLELVQELRLPADSKVLDVGGGTSALAVALAAEGLNVTVLDLAPAALAYAQSYFDAQAVQKIRWLAGDILDNGYITAHISPDSIDLWHDRAVFHFLVEVEQQQRYVQSVARSVKPGGYAIIATFSPDGPEQCSGLPVQRYSSDSLAQLFSPDFKLIGHQRHEHVTPSGAVQPFTFVTLQRKEDQA